MGKMAIGREIESFFCIKFAGSLDGLLRGVNSAYFAGSALSFRCDSRKASVRRFGKFARQIYKSGEFSLKNYVKFQFVCRDFLSSVCVVLLRAG